MRAALINAFLPSDSHGGAESYVDAAARWLGERHDVVALTGSRNGVVEGIRTVSLPGLAPLPHGAPIARRALWHVLDQWLPTVHVAVARELRELAPDVVWTHHPQGLSSAIFTAVAARRLPHVHTAHDLNLLCVRTSMTRDGEFCGGRCASCRIQRTVRGKAIGMDLTKLLGMSRYVVDRHVAAGIVPRERAETVRLGAKEGSSRLRQLNGLPPRLGFIGTLATHKGIPTLLDAFRHAPASWQLLIAGDGPLRGRVAAAAAGDPRIEYLGGHVAGERKEAFFEAIDLVLIPSHWEEPATFVAVEAGIRGVPAVVSDRGGLPETPEARLFHAGESASLLEAIAWFVDEPLRLEQASGRLLARQEEFSWSTHMRRVEKILEESLSSSP